MAATYTLGQALSLLQTSMKIPDVTPYAPIILDETLSFMWSTFDWRNTIGELAPFYLLPREQDYGAPLSAVPADFHQLRRIYIRDVESTEIHLLHVVAQLPATERYDFPEDISYEPEINRFRLHPCPPASYSASRFQVEGTYKKRAAKVTATNINSTVIPWDDVYFGVFRKVLKWKWLEEIGSPAAGSIAFLPNGSVTANGAAASAWSSLANMAQREGIGEPPEQVAPETELFM